jgi:hypothetical protein
MSDYSVYLLYWYKRANTDTEEGVLDLACMSQYSVCLLYWYKSANTDIEEGGLDLAISDSVFLLYWYKRANTDTEEGGLDVACMSQHSFTCFIGTKVQILTQKRGV